MNPCTCRDGSVGMLMCPLHGVKVNGPSFTFPKFDPPPFAPPRWSDYDQPEPWPDLESRPFEGLFEGMSRAGLCQLAEMRVGESMTIQGRDVWRWEESSPATRIISDAHPTGIVTMTDEWLVVTNVGTPDSVLRAATDRWPDRSWWWERDILTRTTRVRWEPAERQALERG